MVIMLMVLAFEWMFHETACANNEKHKQIKKKTKKMRHKMRENFFLTEYLWKSELIFFYLAPERKLYS